MVFIPHGDRHYAPGPFDRRKAAFLYSAVSTIKNKKTGPIWDCFREIFSDKVSSPGGSPPLRASCGRKLRLHILTAGCPAPAIKNETPRSAFADRGVSFLYPWGPIPPRSARRSHLKGLVEVEACQDDPDGNPRGDQADADHGQGYLAMPGAPTHPGKDGAQECKGYKQYQKQHGVNPREIFSGGYHKPN
jgi:hypothetical protein